jgi:hypothetical protein
MQVTLISLDNNLSPVGFISFAIQSFTFLVLSFLFKSKLVAMLISDLSIYKIKKLNLISCNLQVNNQF